MKLLATTALAALVLGSTAHGARAEAPIISGGYVDGKMFLELIDETKEVVEVNLDGAILQAMANSASRDAEGDPKKSEEKKALFAKLKSIHAVIGTVKGPASEALALVRKTDQRLKDAGWQRITRVTDETSTISVLTHTVGSRIDGLVALIFDTEDNELVFANLAGEIDLTRLGEIGEQFNVPGLDHVPGAD